MMSVREPILKPVAIAASAGMTRAKRKKQEYCKFSASRSTPFRLPAEVCFWIGFDLYDLVLVHGRRSN
jgi:hypothetical protein